MDETDLLNKIRHDPASFSGLFKLYYKQIFGYILRRTGDFDDAADIAADTFLKAFRSIGNFRYTGISVKVWLYRIASNELNLFFRYRKKYNSVFERINLIDNDNFMNLISEDKKEIEAELLKHDQFMSVLAQLKTLPLKYQEVIALRFFEEKSNKEIAEILKIKEGTLKSLLSRGLEKLRKKCNQF